MTIKQEREHPKEAGQKPCSYNDTISFPEGKSVAVFADKDQWEEADRTREIG